VLSLLLWSVLVVIPVTLLLPDPLPRKLWAFLTASIFPGLLLLTWVPSFESIAMAQKRLALVFRVVVGLALSCALCGLAIGAFLGDTQFFLTINTFSGIKVAFVMPLLLVAGVLLLIPGSWPALPFKLKRLLETRITLGQAMLAGIALGALVFMLLRSGNASDVYVTGGETHLRGLLEKLMFIRPRFKEFMVGTPALVLLLWFAGRGISARWSGLFLLAAVVGSISMVNSFCHLHTPLLYTLLRWLNGLALGLVVGLLLVVAAHVARLAARRLFR
jgi:hypothetical protein